MIFCFTRMHGTINRVLLSTCKRLSGPEEEEEEEEENRRICPIPRRLLALLWRFHLLYCLPLHHLHETEMAFQVRRSLQGAILVHLVGGSVSVRKSKGFRCSIAEYILCTYKTVRSGRSVTMTHDCTHSFSLSLSLSLSPLSQTHKYTHTRTHMHEHC
jgi:hypothetical protein